MSSKVLRDFNTINRRFKAGDSITKADVEGFAIPWADLVDRGFVEEDETPATKDGGTTAADDHE